MLRDVIVHMRNEQPLLADLLFESAPTDTVLICRNLRTTNGEKPAFINWTDSVFAIPLGHVRFVEIPEAAIATLQAERRIRREERYLRARFGAVYRLDYYDLPAMKAVVKRAAKLLDVPVEVSGIEEIGRRARGTPRVALRLLRRVRDA